MAREINISLKTFYINMEVYYIGVKKSYSRIKICNIRV